MDLIRRVVFMPTAGTGRVRGTPREPRMRAGPSLRLGSEGRLAQGGRCLSARGLGLVTGEVRVPREGAGNAEGSRLWGRPGPRVLPEGSERHASKTPLCLRAPPVQKWPSLHLQLLVQVRGLWPGLSAEGSAPPALGPHDRVLRGLAHPQDWISWSRAALQLQRGPAAHLSR